MLKQFKERFPSLIDVERLKILLAHLLEFLNFSGNLFFTELQYQFTTHFKYTFNFPILFPILSPMEKKKALPLVMISSRLKT